MISNRRKEKKKSIFKKIIIEVLNLNQITPFLFFFQKDTKLKDNHHDPKYFQ